jgi:hypothetical protein
MTSDTDSHPLDALAAHAMEEREQQRRTIEEARQRRDESRRQLDEIVASSHLMPTLQEFQRTHLGEYSRIMQYFGTTPQYDPRHPTMGDFVLYVELQWSEEPIDLGAEDTPAGCHTVQMQVLANGGGADDDSIAFPSIMERCTREEWTRDGEVLKATIHRAYEHAVHSRKKTTQAYRFPYGIQTIYDIEAV